MTSIYQKDTELTIQGAETEDKDQKGDVKKCGAQRAEVMKRPVRRLRCEFCG